MEEPENKLQSYLQAAENINRLSAELFTAHDTETAFNNLLYGIYNSLIAYGIWAGDIDLSLNQDDYKKFIGGSKSISGKDNAEFDFGRLHFKVTERN